MRIDPISKLLGYPYGYRLIPRIELIEIDRLMFDLIFFAWNFFSIKMIFKKMCLYSKKITNNTAPHDQDGQLTLQWVGIKATLHFKCLFT